MVLLIKYSLLITYLGSEHLEFWEENVVKGPWHDPRCSGTRRCRVCIPSDTFVGTRGPRVLCALGVFLPGAHSCLVLPH